MVQPKHAHVSNDASFDLVLWISSLGPFDKGLVDGQQSLGCGEVKTGPGGALRMVVALELFLQSQAYHHLSYILSYSEGSQLELSLCMNKGARFSSSHYFIFHGTSLELNWWY